MGWQGYLEDSAVAKAIDIQIDILLACCKMFHRLQQKQYIVGKKYRSVGYIVFKKNSTNARFPVEIFEFY